MIKRKLKIARRTNNIPILGECDVCKMQFHAHYPLSGPSEAQAAIQQQFNAHKCEATHKESEPVAAEAAEKK
jgi:hypothetical protein